MGYLLNPETSEMGLLKRLMPNVDEISLSHLNTPYSITGDHLRMFQLSNGWFIFGTSGSNPYGSAFVTWLVKDIYTGDKVQLMTSQKIDNFYELPNGNCVMQANVVGSYYIRVLDIATESIIYVTNSAIDRYVIMTKDGFFSHPSENQSTNIAVKWFDMNTKVQVIHSDEHPDVGSVELRFDFRAMRMIGEKLGRQKYKIESHYTISIHQKGPANGAHLLFELSLFYPARALRADQTIDLSLFGMLAIYEHILCFCASLTLSENGQARTVRRPPCILLGADGTSMVNYIICECRPKVNGNISE